jgi:osmoprotectant transport system substrate-binding protein
MFANSNSSRRRSTRYWYVGLLVILAACSRDDRIVVGAKAFTEGYLLGHMAVLVLEDAGYNVEEQFGVASSAMRSALESGQVDLYYEYTGTAYTVYAGGNDPAVMSDSAQVLEAVRRFDLNEHHLEWLQPVPFNDTYALLMRSANSGRDGITSLSDLANRVKGGNDLTIAVDAEFYERPDGLKAMLKHYGIPDRNIIKMDAGLIYTALNEGKIDVGMGYSTDGRIEAFDLVVLEDDRRFFPAYNPAAVVRSELLRREPGVRDALLRLNQRLDGSTIRRLNAEVDLHHRDPRKVARRWLEENGLLHSGNNEAGRRFSSPRSMTLLNDYRTSTSRCVSVPLGVERTQR